GELARRLCGDGPRARHRDRAERYEHVAPRSGARAGEELIQRAAPGRQDDPSDPLYVFRGRRRLPPHQPAHLLPRRSSSDRRRIRGARRVLRRERRRRPGAGDRRSRTASISGGPDRGAGDRSECRPMKRISRRWTPFLGGMVAASLLVVAVLLALTRTDRGREKILAIALETLGGQLHPNAALTVGRLEGGLFTGARMYDITLRDAKGEE